jgi:hypothetical protein
MQNRGLAVSTPDPAASAWSPTSVASSGGQCSRNEETCTGLGITEDRTTHGHPSSSAQVCLEPAPGTMPGGPVPLYDTKLTSSDDGLDHETMAYLRLVWPSASIVTPPKNSLSPEPWGRQGQGQVARSSPAKRRTVESGSEPFDSDDTVPLSSDYDAHVAGRYYPAGRAIIRTQPSLGEASVSEHIESDIRGVGAEKASISSHGSQHTERPDSGGIDDATSKAGISDPHGYESPRISTYTRHQDPAPSPLLPASRASSADPTTNESFPGGHELPETVQDDPKGQSPVVDGRPPSPDAWALRYKRGRSPDSPCPPGRQRQRPSKLSRRGAKDAE